MAHKKFRQMSGIALALSLVLLACPNTVEEDTWSDVTGIQQLNGTWKYTGSETMTLAEVMEEKHIDLGDIPGAEGMEDMVAGIAVTESTEWLNTINAATMKSSGSTTVTTTFSGENIDVLWVFIKPYLTGTNVTIDDVKHSMMYTSSYTDEDITENEVTEMIADVQINQNGTKIKTPIYSDSEDAGSGSSPEKTKIGERLFIKQ